MNRIPSAYRTAACLFVLAVSSGAAERPIGLTLKKVSTYRADLFWFYRGINESVAAYDDGGSEYPIGVHEDDRDNRMAVRFCQFTPPTYICGGSAYVLNFDDNESLPGTPLSPFELSLHDDDDGVPGRMISGPVMVSATGNWTYGGEWVCAEFGYIHSTADPLWLQVRWPSTNPFMPKIGCDGSAPDNVSMYGYLTGGEDVWDCVVGCDVMLRLNVLCNTQELSPDPDMVPVDSFRIYGGDRLPIGPGNSFYTASTCGSKLHQRVAVEAIDNYFCVTSWQDTQESDPSEIVQISGSGGHSAPATVTPLHLKLTVPEGEGTTSYIAIRNKSSDSLWYRYRYGHLSPGGSPGIPVVILNGSGRIEAGATDSVEFVIASQDLPLGDYYHFGTIEFWDDEEVYLPEYVSIHLSVDRETAVDEPSQYLPAPLGLCQNFPNPFNSETTVLVTNPGTAATISLRIVDIVGHLVTELAPAFRSGEVATFEWNGEDLLGNPCASGVYFYSVSNGNGVWKKMLLIR